MIAGMEPESAQRSVDTQHLNLLSIFHFVGAGLAALGVGFVVLHYMLLHSVFDNPAVWKGAATPPPADFLGVFKWFYVAMGGWLGLSLVANLLTGLYLRARKHRVFCLVTAAFNCLQMPFGTILGIFTIIVLVRDSVRAVFEPRPFDVDRLG